MGLFGPFRKKETDVERYQRELDARRGAQCAAAAANAEPPVKSEAGAVLLTVKDVFTIAGRGTVVVGRCERPFAVGEPVFVLCPDGSRRGATVSGIEKFRKTTDYAQPGENVGVLLRDLAKRDVSPGAQLQRR